MHWTDRPTDRQTNRSLTGKFDDYRPLSLYRQQSGLTIKVGLLPSWTSSQTVDLDNFVTASRSSLGVVNKAHRWKNARGLMIAPPMVDALPRVDLPYIHRAPFTRPACMSVHRNMQHRTSKLWPLSLMKKLIRLQPTFSITRSICETWY